MGGWSEVSVEDVDIEFLEDVIKDKGIPVHINVLTREYVKNELKHEIISKKYSPKGVYSKGSEIQFNGKKAEVIEVRNGENPKQGCFQIVTLRLFNGAIKRMAANVGGEIISGDEPIKDRKITRIINKEGKLVRYNLSEAMNEDDRFTWFESDQGDEWCWAELLPEVGESKIEDIESALVGLLENGIINPKTTDEIIRLFWEKENDGNEEYLLLEFAINTTLQEYKEFRYLGRGWVLEEEWKQLQERDKLKGPRGKNIVTIPKGVEEKSRKQLPQEDQSDETDEDKEPDEISEDDFLEWSKNRRLNAKVVMSANHYYGNWLPLLADMQKVFPPRASQAYETSIYHQFSGQEEKYASWVDWEQKRILGSPDFMKSFHDNGIYPGAKLIISHRGNLHEYDIRIIPIAEQKTLPVKRAFIEYQENGEPELDEKGLPVIGYEVFNEPIKYEISEVDFITAASWEDIPALYAEAEKVRLGYFGLVYKVCCKWWEEKNREPLYVTADELFTEIHDNHRMMRSGATIPWILWRQLAFKFEGAGKYLFRPGYRGQERTIVTGKKTKAEDKKRSRIKVKKGKTIKGRARKPHKADEKEAEEDKTRNLWELIQSDKDKKLLLKKSVEAYKKDASREIVLFIREKAHEQIRELLTRERIQTLTLDEFNQNIWQIGTISCKGNEYHMDAEGEGLLPENINIEELEEAYINGDLQIVGNQTWGSGSSVIGPNLGLINAEKEELVKKSLNYLLYGDGEIEERMQKLISESNGFGMNVVTGIVHTIHPERRVLYNSVSKSALEKLGFSWPENWYRDIGTYNLYLDFCINIKDEFELKNLSDVDWFMYLLVEKKFDSPETQDAESLFEKYIFSLNPDEYIGWVVVHQRKLKGYYDLWSDYLEILDQDDTGDAARAKNATGIHWRGTMHARYFGLLTEERIVTEVGKEFYSSSSSEEKNEILHKQLQKWYYWIDLFYRRQDPNYKLFPYFTLLEILTSTPETEYATNWDEFRFFILPTRTLDEVGDRIKLIMEYREDPESWGEKLNKIFKHTYINRIHQFLELSPYIKMEHDKISLNTSSIDEIQILLSEFKYLESKRKIPHYQLEPQKYWDMLYSSESLVNFCA